VSCTKANACTAVGYYTVNGGPGVLLAERWNGTQWSIETTPAPTGATASELNGVSCVSGSACTAVGDYTNSSGRRLTLAERWNGTKWSIEPSPNVGSDDNELQGVSCPSASACTAVGDFYAVKAAATKTLAERWNGSTWSLQSSPSAAATDSDLRGVSCPSAIACVAVGDYGSGPGVWIERWNGSRWSTQSAPNPTGSTLYGVSCISGSACTAVGNHQSNTQLVPLAERWNGIKWSQEHPLTPPDLAPTSSGESFLRGVSCPSTSSCTAAGDYYNSMNIEVTLAEGWTR
jgi:hypothetical protein